MTLYIKNCIRLGEELKVTYNGKLKIFKDMSDDDFTELLLHCETYGLEGLQIVVNHLFLNRRINKILKIKERICLKSVIE